MNILLLGGGGREHALAWKLVQSKHCGQLFVSPGNPGTAQLGKNVALDVNDFDAIEHLIRKEKIAMVVVGPEDPLVNGIIDFLDAAHFAKPFGSQWLGVVGPAKYAAQLEGSKAFSKKFMQRHGIPTAGYAEFTLENYNDGQTYLAMHRLPIVLKADGLAAGKGVVICQSHAEAATVFAEMILNKQFGAASSKVVVEEFLDGIEISVFVLTDGKDYKIIGHAKDYKRIGEGDTGLNTGGMGCVSPVPFAQGPFMQKVIDRIITPTIQGLHKEKFNYKGFVFFGLIKVGDEPMVIEYNCRMGDPETEVVMPKLQSDLLMHLVDLLQGNLSKSVVEINNAAAATVMLVSGGYPGKYKKGIPITELPKLPSDGKAIIFHAGTSTNENQELVTNGGRVMAITCVANTIQQAAAASVELAAKIKFENSYFRSDIGYEFNA